MTEDMPTEGLDLDELASVLSREYDNADQYSQTLATLQDLAFKYYEADISTFPAREGGSQIILPDVQESIDYMVQSVLRTFLSGDHAVEFEATDEGDQQAADDATVGLGFNFFRQQDGARLLYDSLNDGLLKKLGIFKTAVETEEKVSREIQEFQSEEELALYVDQAGCEVEAVKQADNGTLLATLKHERSQKKFVDYAVPVTRFKFSPNARHEDDADYLCHAELKTRSELVEMGFDKDQVYRLAQYGNSQTWRENESSTLDNQWRDAERPELEEVLLCHEFARIDLDGDGIAERVEVYRVETEILIDAETGEPSIETVDEQPFAIFSPFPRPHRMVGYSLADKVMDIQLARSFVARQLFDGLALANMPRPIVDTMMADQDTYTDILSPIPGSPIRIKGGANSIQPFSGGFDIGKSMTAMEWLTGERESRTGITRLNQGLDADALNKTATGTALMQAQGQQGEEMIARQLAETLSRLFMKKYRLMRIEGEPFKVKVDGKYRVIDPRTWPEDVNVKVRVGLGSNSKDKRVQARMMLAQLLAEGTQIGEVEPKHRFNAIDGLVRDLGLGNGADYWTDPDAPPEIDPATGQPVEKPEKPDPAMAKVQAEAQMQQAKMAGEQQLAQTRLQLQQEEAQAKQELARQQAEFDAQLAAEKANRESDLAQARMVMEERLAEQRLEMEMRMASHKAKLAQDQADAQISQNRPGGSLDA